MRDLKKHALAEYNTLHEREKLTNCNSDSKNKRKKKKEKQKKVAAAAAAAAAMGINDPYNNQNM
jgi:hypothetical protein